MTLSPAAHAVLEAFFIHAGSPSEGISKAGMAAALRAVEEHLANDKPPAMDRDLEVAVLRERIRLFRIISAIATELENAS